MGNLGNDNPVLFETQAGPPSGVVQEIRCRTQRRAYPITLDQSARPFSMEEDDPKSRHFQQLFNKLCSHFSQGIP
ncbi:hypothetical protein V6N13_010782 [Hibiscus sabdariffa]